MTGMRSSTTLFVLSLPVKNAVTSRFMYAQTCTNDTHRTSDPQGCLLASVSEKHASILLNLHSTHGKMARSHPRAPRRQAGVAQTDLMRLSQTHLLTCVCRTTMYILDRARTLLWLPKSVARVAVVPPWRSSSSDEAPVSLLQPQ
jgi:hypothetical protein